ncbi:MAG: hypothetical protein CMM06_02495 [Rhodopirellula sp.]|nr:hypothetical protein [Rhodopirellula sp.]|tara:strand:+ start:50712 stop:51716 length:1005 start_codon:yes stop_codon:yes gene_type:complete
MYRTFIRSLAVVGLLALGISTLDAAGPKITDPAKVDSDYALQGEYSGSFENNGETYKAGAQIIALGNAEFAISFYPGGLPGDGFGKDKSKVVRANGKLENGSVKFTGEKGSAVLSKDGIALFDTDGNGGPVLKKVNRKSPTLGAKPPKGAVVLFDGSNVDNWKNGRLSDDGLLMEGTTSKNLFQDHRLHLEFRIPYQPLDRGQGRGNSGIYVQGRYEIQMLDSFGLHGAMNECGGIYSVTETPINMAFPPLIWQTYDIYYTAGRYDDNQKVIKHPSVTVYHNGVKIHDKVQLPGERNTTAAPLKAGPAPGPVFLQNHGCPVRYRNIWVVESAEE